MEELQKNLEISLLFDFYAPLLTEKQRESIEFYYNHDLSLAEIAQHSGITRQGVRDSIKRAEAQLFDYEEKLGLFRRFHQRQEKAEEIIASATTIQEENERFGSSRTVAEQVEKIIHLAGTLNDATEA